MLNKLKISFHFDVLLIRKVFIIQKLREFFFESLKMVLQTIATALFRFTFFFKQPDSLHHFLPHNAIRNMNFPFHCIKVTFMRLFSDNKLFFQSLNDLVFFINNKLHLEEHLPLFFKVAIVSICNACQICCFLIPED